MKKTVLTQHEWYDAMKIPLPNRNKKKYYKKKGSGKKRLFSRQLEEQKSSIKQKGPGKKLIFAAI